MNLEFKKRTLKLVFVPYYCFPKEQSSQKKKKRNTIFFSISRDCSVLLFLNIFFFFLSSWETLRSESNFNRVFCHFLNLFRVFMCYCYWFFYKKMVRKKAFFIAVYAWKLWMWPNFTVNLRFIWTSIDFGIKYRVNEFSIVEKGRIFSFIPLQSFFTMHEDLLTIHKYLL